MKTVYKIVTSYTLENKGYQTAEWHLEEESERDRLLGYINTLLEEGITEETKYKAGVVTCAPVHHVFNISNFVLVSSEEGLEVADKVACQLPPDGDIEGGLL